MNQLTQGKSRRVMYVENKDGDIDRVPARIGWVRFSRTGRAVYFHGRRLTRIKGGGIRGNYLDTETNEEYWLSGVKKHGSNVHWAERVSVAIDEGAYEEYQRIVRG